MLFKVKFKKKLLGFQNKKWSRAYIGQNKVKCYISSWFKKWKTLNKLLYKKYKSIFWYNKSIKNIKNKKNQNLEKKKKTYK